MTALALCGWVLTLPVVLSTGIFALEAIFGAIVPRRHARATPSIHTAVVVIPAHDEEKGIGPTLNRLMPQLRTGIRLLVVADNCTDGTPEIARRLGVEVIERADPSRRGKGYALDFARHHLRADPPKVVVIVDADSVLESGSLEELITACAESCVPVQSDNRLRPIRAEARVEISSFSFYVKNTVRQLGMVRLGGPSLLTGTGMAIPWPLFEVADLANGSVVEDLDLSIQFTELGYSPSLVPNARVWSDPAPFSAMLAQRRRWEGGFLSTAITRAPLLLLHAVARRQWQTFMLALHLLVPPLALLTLMNLAALAVIARLAVATTSLTQLALLLGTQILACSALIAAWLRGGRAYLGSASVFALPLYVLWKIPLYLKIARGRAGSWSRTDRS